VWVVSEEKMIQNIRRLFNDTASITEDRIG
jgi:hypothetical protein